jgi:hypothetical protein
MHITLRLVLLPLALALVLVGCRGVEHSGQSGALPTLPRPTADTPRLSPTIEVPPPR